MKKIAPIIITIFVSGYLCVYIGMMFFASSDEAGIVKVFLGIICIGLAGIVLAMIYTMITRLREIDKEDDDDLSKY